MTRRIPSCRGNTSPDQPPTLKEQPDTQTASTVCQLPFIPGACVERESSQPPPPTNSAGIKRERYGQPETHAPNQRFRGSRSSLYGYSSVDDPENSFSTSGSDSDDSSCSDSEHASPDAAQEYVLPHDHRFQSLRSELVKSALDSLDAWMESTRYGPPPDDRPPPRKRLRTPHWKEGNNNDDSINGFVAASPLVGYFHLACPFYVYNPPRYQQCLLQFNLRSIEDIIRHLRRHHMKPPYCARCSRIFDTLFSRDSHILERTCELLDPQPIQGLSFYQESKLRRRDKIYLSDAKRWRNIYAISFPESDPAYSPYLDRGCGKEVSMARDYWRANGRLCVRQFLERGKLLGEEEERDRAAEDALCQLTLEDMLCVIVQRYGNRREDFDG
ncbi:hypothetical protein NCS52_01518400 [Fusarium sp. LHS14.1]|nr:hypothetical protein NCS52_01518400 [Fusarium sp. LHS14.1]